MTEIDPVYHELAARMKRPKSKVLNVHPGAVVSQFTPSSESGIFGSWWTVKCSTCGCVLGSGASEQAAWREAVVPENQFPCVTESPLVDADFTVSGPGVTGRNT